MTACYEDPAEWLERLRGFCVGAVDARDGASVLARAVASTSLLAAGASVREQMVEERSAVIQERLRDAHDVNVLVWRFTNTVLG